MRKEFSEPEPDTVVKKAGMAKYIAASRALNIA